MYTFRLKKVTLLLILGLCGLAGALIFTAGMAVGVHWTLSKPMLEARLGTAPATPGNGSPPASLPGTSGAAAGPALAAGGRAAGVVAPPPVTVPTVSPPTVPAAGVAWAAIETPPAAPPPTAPEPEVASAAPDAAEAPDGDPRFSVQVGAYLYEENSARMLAELQQRGYEPYVVKKAGSDDRVLETVRFGHYPSRQQASLAAAEFMDREGLEAAIVREPGAL